MPGGYPEYDLLPAVSSSMAQINASQQARKEIITNLEAVIDCLCCTVKDLAEVVQRVASITHRRRLIDALLILISLAA